MIDLVEYRISYGECVGYCTSVLTVDGSTIELVQIGNGPDADERRYTGEITAGLARTIASEAAKLEQRNLSAVYGTPDARDEGAVTVRIEGSGGVSDHTYSRGAPPGAFSHIDQLLSPILLGWIDGVEPPDVRFTTVP